MAIANFPTRQAEGGFIFSLQHLKVLEGPNQFRTLQSLEASGEIEGRKEVMGAGTKPLGRTPGTLKVSAKIGIILDEFNDFVNANPRYLHKEFDITARLKSGPRSMKIQLVGFAIMSAPVSLEGSEESKVVLEGTCLDIVINGVSLVEGDEESFNT